MFFEPARYKVAYGGRGSSKSWGAAMALVIQSLQSRHFILCAREVQLSIRDSSKRVVSQMIDRLGVRDLFRETDTYIECPTTGSRFIFWGLRDGADKLKSAEGLTRVWIEEANTVSQTSLDTLHPTVREPGSEIWYTFNPGLPTDPVYAMFVDTTDPPPGSIVRKVNHDQNPWFPEVLREQMLWDRSRDPDKFRHVWEGEPVQHSEAQVFAGRWRIEPTPEPPKGTPLYHGADWGFAADPTTLVRCWMSDRRLYVSHAVFGYRVEITDTPALFAAIPGAEAWEIIADSARPEMIAHMRNHGYPRIVASSKGAGSVESGIAYLRNFDIVVDPRCKELIDEFHLYCYKTDKRTGQIQPDIVDANNHGIDALRYATEKAMRAERRGAVKIRVRASTRG